jgi:hypothetical protein
MEKLRIKPCSYMDYQHISGGDDIIELYPTYMKYYMKAVVKVKDDVMGNINKHYDVEALIMRSSVQAVEFGYSHEREVYEVLMLPVGLVFVFESKEDGDKINKKLADWLIS